jgi:hypothetical protein
MIRNHLLDPNGIGGNPPQPGGYRPYGGPVGGAAAAAPDDPWFNQGLESPITGDPTYGKFSGFDPAPRSQQMMQPPALGVDIEDYETEPPLLEELGIRFDHIWSKTQAVVNPTQVCRFIICELHNKLRFVGKQI